MQDVTEVKNMIKAAKEIEITIKDLQNKRQNFIEEAQKLCSHPTYIKKDDYFSGNYYDKASTETKTYCSVCGLLLNTTTEEHGYYG